MKCDEHILLRFLASSLSVCLTVPPLSASLPASLSVVATVLTLCNTDVVGGRGRGQRFPFLWMWMRLWIALDVRAWQSLRLFFLSPSLLPPSPSLYTLLSSVFQLHHSSMTIKTIRGRCCCCFCWPNTSQQIVVITAPVAFRLSLPDVIMSVFVPPTSTPLLLLLLLPLVPLMLNVAYNYGKSCMKQQTATTTTKRFIFSYELKSFCCAFVFAIAIDAVRNQSQNRKISNAWGIATARIPCKMLRETDGSRESSNWAL